MYIEEKSEETESLEELQESLRYKNEQIQDCLRVYYERNCDARLIPVIEKLRNEAQEIQMKINQIMTSQTCQHNSMTQY